MPTILTVAELTRAVKDVLETEFPFVWVRGQVGNVSRPASGHIYFTLTDGESALSVVWFKSAQWRREEGGAVVNPATGEILEPDDTSGESASGHVPDIEEGRELLCAGRLNVYERRGVYQLVAELVQQEGVGDLHLAFEALKRDLAQRGWFDAERKKPLPSHPWRVALVTSPRGAAVRDFLRLAEERGWGMQIRLYPALVQGDRAPKAIAEALARADDDAWAEVVALVRGGGSLEDLWAFNSEEVARAMVQSRIPVVTGVGHEPDVTIADYVADRRAATPSHAAQLLWPRRTSLMQQVDDLQLRLENAFARSMQVRSDRLHTLRRSLHRASPGERLDRLSQGFTQGERRLERTREQFFQRHGERLSRLGQRLGRGFGVERIRTERTELRHAVDRLHRAAAAHLDRAAHVLELRRSRLSGLDPALPLERGYSLVRRVDTNTFLRSIEDAVPGLELAIQVRDGIVPAKVSGRAESFVPSSPAKGGDHEA